MRTYHANRLALCLLALLTLPALLLGCGGGSGGSGSTSATGTRATGKVTFNIKWPKTAHLIPAAAMSIVISATLPGTTFSQTFAPIVLPTTSATYTLPVGNVSITATAYPTTTGSGVAQATGSMTVDIAEGTDTPATITMSTTVSKVVVNPTSVSTTPGVPTTLMATAEDPTGATVLVAPGNLFWTVPAQQVIALLGSTGTSITMTGLSAGTTTVTVTEKDSGKSVQIPVTINPAIFVADSTNKLLVALSGLDASNAQTFPALPPTTDPLSNPHGVAIDSSGNIYIADTGNNRIVEISSINATPTSVMATSASLGLSSPQGVAVDSSGDIYIADTGNNRVVEIKGISAMTPTVSPVSFTAPAGIAVDSSGNIYVANTGANNVVKLSSISATNPVTTPAEALSGPQGVAVDSSGNVYVADTGNNRIVEFSNNLTTTVNTYSAGLSGPEGLALDSQGRIYIADTGNSRILRINGITGLDEVSFGNKGMVTGATTMYTGQFETPVGIVAH